MATCGRAATHCAMSRIAAWPAARGVTAASSTLAREGRSQIEIATVLGHETLEVVKRYSHVNVKTAIVRTRHLRA